MDRTMMWVGVLVASMSVMGCGGGDSGGGDGAGGEGGGAAATSTKAVEPGAESPEAAMKKLADAVANDDTAALAAMLPAENEEQKATNKKMAGMLLTMKRVPKIMEQANAKFGQDKVAGALGFGGMMLAGMSPPDFNKIAAEGEFVQEGDNASYVLAQQEGPMKTEQKIDLKKIDERWYAAIEGPPPGEDMDKAVKSITEMVSGLEAAVSNSSDADAFAKAVGEVMAKMMQAAQPAGDAPGGDTPEVPSSVPVPNR